MKGKSVRPCTEERPFQTTGDLPRETLLLLEGERGRGDPDSHVERSVPCSRGGADREGETRW